MKQYLGRIVGAASLAPSGQTIFSALPCRRRPSRRACPGALEVTRQDVPSRVLWSCPRCGDGGEIEGWRDGPHDLSTLREVHDPCKLVLGRDEQRFGLGLDLPDTAGAAVFLRARRQSAGGIETVSPGVDLQALSAWVEGELELGAHGERVRGQLRRLLESLDVALGRTPTVDQTALLAGVSTGVYPLTAAQPVQIKVTLRDVSPPLWRRLALPGELTLGQLHEVLQTAFGWLDGHLHSFLTSDRRQIGDPDQLEAEVENEHGLRLADVLFRKGQRLTYEYDFGDDWNHEVLVEQVLTEPVTELRCLAGRRAGPPEDCGGPPGYAELIRAHADPEHPRNLELMEWHPYLAPEEFDLEDLNARLGAMFRQA